MRFKEKMEQIAWATGRNVYVGVRPDGNWFCGGLGEEWDVTGPQQGAKVLADTARDVARKRLDDARSELAKAEAAAANFQQEADR